MRSSTLLALAALGLVSLAARPAVAGTLLVPQQFSSIQKALNAAKPYDTVLVSAKPKGGVYNEAVTLSTPHVVLQGVGNPVLDGTSLGTLVPQRPPFQPFYVYPNGIDIRADGVAVRGLTVQNTNSSIFGASSSGVNVGYVSADGQTDYGFSNVEISNVTVTKNVNGITVMGYSGTSPYYGGTPTLTKNLCLLGDVISGNTGSQYQVFGSVNNISGTTGTLISGCQFSGNPSTGLVFGSNPYGVPSTQNAQIVGSTFSGNTGDGLDAYGSGLLLSANEVAANTGYGVYTDLTTYNPAVTTPGSPNPAASALLFNSVHDNKGGGLYATGTQAISGNSLAHNLGFGLYLSGADYSQVSFNQISGTGLTGYYGDDGTGIYAESFPAYTSAGGISAGGPVLLSANSLTGNAGDGVFLDAAGSTISYNNASGNSGIGIHLSDKPSLYTYYGDIAAGNTVTQNTALHNTVFDARDDASASDDVTYNGATSYGDASAYGPSLNVWTKNLFGKTDPAGLSK